MKRFFRAENAPVLQSFRRSMYSSNDLIILAPEQSVFQTATGEFARQVLVLSLSDPATADSTRPFLSKILAAAQLNLAQDALFVELPLTQPVSLLTDTRQKKPEQVLVFGLPARQLGLNMEITPYQPFVFQQITFLFADPLSVLEGDKEKKGALWTALKSIFL